MKKAKTRPRRASSGANPRPARGSSRAPHEGEPGFAGFRSPVSAYDSGEAVLLERIPADGPALAATARAAPPALRSLEAHGYSRDEIFALVVPKRTFARRVKHHEPLTVEETDRAIR